MATSIGGGIFGRQPRLSVSSCLLFMIIVSSCVAIFAADHLHSGDDCRVCANIAEHLSIFIAPPAIAGRACGILTAAAISLPDELSASAASRRTSPISLRVKLSA